MHQREGELCRIERLQRKVQHDAGILADRIEHHRLFELGNDVAHDLDGLGLQPPQMPRQRVCFRSVMFCAFILKISGELPTR